MIAELKLLANKKDMPYQSLVKLFLARQIIVERGSLAKDLENTSDYFEGKHSRGTQF